MKTSNIRISLASFVLTLIYCVLTLVFWNFVRDTIVVPIYYLIWLAGLILKSIPQGTYLALLIVISLLIGMNTLIKIQVKRLSISSERSAQEEASRYRFWLKLYTNSQSGDSRLNFAFYARNLILSILSYQEGLDLSETERKVANNDLKVPVAVKKLIQERDQVATQQPKRRFVNWGYKLRRFIRRKDLQDDLLINKHIEEIIHFIESRLEINHDGNRP